MHILRRDRGSAIIEMAIVFPVILILLLVMLVVGMLLYEQVASQAIMNDVVSKGAANWATAEYGIDMELPTGGHYDALRVYWRLVDTQYRNKIAAVEQAAYDRLVAACLFKDTFDRSEVRLTSKNYFVYKRFHLDVVRRFQLPFGGFLRVLGIDDQFDYQLSAVAVVQDAPELIRTVDMATDVAKKLGPLADFYGGITKYSGKFTDFFSKLSFKTE